MNGTGAPLGAVTESPEASTVGSDGSPEASIAPDSSGTGLPDATLPDSAVHDGSASDASVHETSTPDAASLDGASGDGSVDAPTCVAANGGACIVVPTGWSIVAFSEGRTNPCPGDFNAGANDVVEGPNANGACSCGACTVTTQPSCDQGSIGATYGTDGHGGFGGGGGQATCTTAGTALAIDPGGNCTAYPSGGVGQNAFSAVEYTPPAPAGGSCSSPGVADPSQIQYAAHERVCSAGASVTQACSGGEPCTGNVDGGYMVCIMMPGAPVACPTGSALSTPHWVGGPASLTCGDCGCGIDANTCSGTLDTFRDGTCTMMDSTFPVDGTCQSSFTAANASAYRYVPNAVSATCTATGTSSATDVALTSPATICCPQ